MMNGVDRGDFDELRGLVLRHDSELSNLVGIPAMVRKVVDQVNRVESLVNELSEWKEDSKVQHINSLTGQVRMHEEREEKIREEARRDQLDRKRSIRAAIISVLSTLVAAWVAAKLGVKLP